MSHFIYNYPFRSLFLSLVLNLCEHKPYGKPFERAYIFIILTLTVRTIGSILRNFQSHSTRTNCKYSVFSKHNLDDQDHRTKIYVH